MSRPNRQLRKSYKVFCEGDTEYNYIEGLRKQRRLHIRIKTIEPNRRPVGDSLPSLSTTIKTASCQGGLFCLLSSCF